MIFGRLHTGELSIHLTAIRYWVLAAVIENQEGNC